MNRFAIAALLASTSLAHAQVGPPQTFWNEAITPAAPANTPAYMAKYSGVEVGLTFQASVPGAITGLNFYKSAGETGNMSAAFGMRRAKPCLAR